LQGELFGGTRNTFSKVIFDNLKSRPFLSRQQTFEGYGCKNPHFLIISAPTSDKAYEFGPGFSIFGKYFLRLRSIRGGKDGGF